MIRAVLAAALALPAAGAELPLDRIQLPPGFTIELVARVPGARSLALGARGTLFVGTRDDAVFAVRDGRVIKLLSGLATPNGVAFRDGALYVAEVSRVLRVDRVEERLDDPGVPVVVSRAFPSDRHHGWKFIRFGPDGLLYVPVGAPCNVCRKDDPYASITRMRPDGSGLEVFARGVRNTVGFDWQPGSGTLYFTDNGRDRMGDDVPPDELNAAPKAGLHFGFPHCHGRAVTDPEHSAGRPCSSFTPPVAELGAHVAALGMRFYTGTAFPESYRGAIFIAEHGSWNRSSKVGYRVMLVRLGERPTYEPFATGWLAGERAWGRPVDVEVTPDGALLVSDDEAGAVYRISYRAPEGGS